MWMTHTLTVLEHFDGGICCGCKVRDHVGFPPPSRVTEDINGTSGHFWTAQNSTVSLCDLFLSVFPGTAFLHDVRSTFTTSQSSSTSVPSTASSSSSWSSSKSASSISSSLTPPVVFLWTCPSQHWKRDRFCLTLKNIWCLLIQHYHWIITITVHVWRI